jgi:hypothetical protein
MAVTIITKNSSTASSVPGAGSLSQGELAVNVTDKKLYTKDAGGNVITLASGTSGDVVGPASSTANAVPLYNGTSGKLLAAGVAPGTAGNVLTSDGTTWASTAPAASGATKGQAIAFSLIFGL